jgi:hypothetical protein
VQVIFWILFVPRHDALTPLCGCLHDESDHAVARALDGESREELELEALGLGLGAQATIEIQIFGYFSITL